MTPAGKVKRKNGNEALVAISDNRKGEAPSEFISQVAAVSWAETQQPETRLATHRPTKTRFLSANQVEVFGFCSVPTPKSKNDHWGRIYLDFNNFRPGYSTVRARFPLKVWGDGSHLGGTGVRSYDLPPIGELLQIHRGVPHHFLVGIRQINRPPGEGECESGLQEPDLDPARFDESHGATIRVAFYVRVVQFLPAIHLLRIDHHQQLRRFPVSLQMPFDVVSIPAIEHS